MHCFCTIRPLPLSTTRSFLPHSPFSSEEERKSQRRRHTHTHNRPPGHNDLLVAKRGARVPHQMPQAVEAVEGKGQREESFGSNLQHIRPGRERRRQRRRLEVPAEHRRREVGDAEEVEGTGEGDAGNAIKPREDPRYLRLVNREMGGNGPVEALGREDGVCFVVGDCCCRCRSAGGGRWVSSSVDGEEWYDAD